MVWGGEIWEFVTDFIPVRARGWAEIPIRELIELLAWVLAFGPEAALPAPGFAMLGWLRVNWGFHCRPGNPKECAPCPGGVPASLGPPSASNDPKTAPKHPQTCPKTSPKQPQNKPKPAPKPTLNQFQNSLKTTPNHFTGG